MRENTRLIIVTGLSSIDLLSTDRLLEFYRKLKGKGIKFYLAGHISTVNEQLITYGAEELIHDGVVKMRLYTALADGGLTPPYPLEEQNYTLSEDTENDTLEAFTWAYGKYAGPRLERLARELAEEFVTSGGSIDMDKLGHAERALAGEYWNSADEEEFLGLLDMSLAMASNEKQKSAQAYPSQLRKIIERRIQLERQIAKRGDLATVRELIRLRLKREAHFLAHHPEAATYLHAQMDEYMKILQREEPDIAALIEQVKEELSNTNEQEVT